MVTLYHSCFDQQILKKQFFFVCSGIQNNMFYTARQSDYSFGNFSGVKRLRQGHYFSRPQTDSTLTYTATYPQDIQNVENLAAAQGLSLSIFGHGDPCLTYSEKFSQ